MTNIVVWKLKENVSSKSKQQVVIKFGNTITSDDFQNNTLSDDLHTVNQKTALDAEKYCWALLGDSSVDFANRLAVVGKDTVGLTNEVFVHLKTGAKISDFKDYLRGFGLLSSKVQIDPTTYILKFPSRDIITIANTLHESNKFALATGNYFFFAKRNGATVRIPKHLKKPVSPEFLAMSHFSAPQSVNDPLANNQLYGSNIQLDNAWAQSTGTGVVVAVLDDGVYLGHPDIVANLNSPGFDGTGSFSNGACNNNSLNAHGTGCAGIICATANNNIGIAGIAYGSKLESVRISYGIIFGGVDVITPASFYNAIVYARNYADIMSISYDVTNRNNQDNALINASTGGGRSRQGMPIFAAAGNENSTSLSYPATLSSVVMAVGATDLSDNKASFSNYGTLSVSGPGVNLPTLNNDGTYVYFSGTSAATPAVAAVAALVLSANPNLNSGNIRYILESTCDKVGGYFYYNDGVHTHGTYSSELGYGRVNAFSAVKAALNWFYAIRGPGGMCGTTGYALSTKSGDAVTWSASPAGIVNVYPNGGSVTLQKIGSGYFTLTATINSAALHGYTISRSLSTIQAVTYVNGNTVGSCNGGWQDWSLSAAANMANSTNWQWSSAPATGSTINLSYNGSSCTAHVYGGGSVQVTYVDGCGETSPQNGMTVYASCQHFAKVNVYPNPTQSIVNVDFNSFQPISNNKSSLFSNLLVLPETVDLFSKESTRSIMILTQSKIKENHNVATFQIKGLKPGFYFIHINYRENTEEHTIQVF